MTKSPSSEPLLGTESVDDDHLVLDEDYLDFDQHHQNPRVGRLVEVEQPIENGKIHDLFPPLNTGSPFSALMEM